MRKELLKLISDLLTTAQKGNELTLHIMKDLPSEKGIAYIDRIDEQISSLNKLALKAKEYVDKLSSVANREVW